MSVFIERRRPALSRALLVRVALAWAVIAAVLLATNLPALIGRQFPDPDDTLRLVQVRDLIGGQGWFDLTQHRIDAPGGGVAMHWSRLVDLPIAAVIVLLRGLIGQGAAEMVAVVAVPLLTFGVALVLAGRIAWRVIGDEAAGFACLAMALSVPVLAQLRPMRIDHHGWQIVCALAAVNALMARSPRLGGWAAGAALAAWLSISIEGLPLAAAICGVMALRWLRDRREAMWFVATLQGLAAGSAVLFALTRGAGAMAPYCDAMSPPHLAALALGAVAATGLARIEPMPRFALVGGLAGIAALAAATLAAMAPQCVGGAFAQLDPLVARFWYDGVGEGLPIWQQDAPLVLQTVVPPLVGLVACLQLIGRSGGWLRRWWQDYALVLAAALAIAVFVTRAGAVAGALAAVPLGWQIREWLRSARSLRRPGRRALAMAGMALALLPALPLTLFALAMPARAAVSGSAVPAISTCNLSANAPVFARLPRGEIMAPLDIGPQLLYETHHTVVATGHHRGAQPMHTTIATFLGTQHDARRVLAARGTRYLAVCPDLAEAARYRAAAPAGFMAELLAGREPRWLEPLPTVRGSSLRLWRVRA